MMKTLPIVVVILLLGGPLYIGSPFLGCWYNHSRFGRYVHVQVDLPSCGETASGQVSRPCRYIFPFEGAEVPEAFQFAGTDLHHSYDRTKRTYTVSGMGHVAKGNNVIEPASPNVFFNNQLLPPGQQDLVFVNNDGKLVSGYCDVSW